MDAGKSDTIPTNLRLLTVLEEVARAGVPVTPTAVNDVLGLPKPTIHRLFATLEDEGFLQRDMDGRTYSPGPRLRQLAGGIIFFLFGAKRLPEMGKGIGEGIKNFKKSIKGSGDDAPEDKSNEESNA